jgi:hypothetical protein
VPQCTRMIDASDWQRDYKFWWAVAAYRKGGG